MAEGIGADLLHRGGQIQLTCEAGAAEGGGADGLHRGGQIQLTCEAGEAEGGGADGREGLRPLKGGQGLASIKGIVWDLRRGRIKRDTGERGAFVEDESRQRHRWITAGSGLQARQLGTPVKGVLAERHGVGQRHLRQGRAPPEGLGRHLGHTAQVRGTRQR